jgi:hypothetical protein
MSNDAIVGGGGYPDAEPEPKRRRGLIVGVVAGVVAAVGLPLGGFAVYNSLSGGGAQPHDALPGDAIGYLRVDVDPSAGQKVQGLRLLQKFPGFTEATGLDDPQDDVRKAMFDAIKGEDGCDLDFEDDVDPWLGERLGVAAFAPVEGEPDPGVAVAVQVKDEDAARSGIEDLLACGDSGAKEAGWAYYNDYLIIAETQELADGYAKDAEADPLAANEAFDADMERLGEQGVASFWFDGAGLIEAIRSSPAAMMSADGPTLEQAGEAVDQSAVSGAGALRFDDSYAELAMVVGGKAYEELGDVDPVQIDLPESTAFAVGGADMASLVERQWDLMAQMDDSGTSQDQIEQFEAETGFNLPEDLQTLFGDNFVLSLDSSGLDEVFQSFDTASLNLGASIATDQEKFDALYGKLQDLAAKEGIPLQLNKVDTDDGVIVAANPDYADRLGEGGDLTDSDRFTTAVADADEAQSFFYLDFEVVQTLAAQFAGDDQEFLDNLEPLQAVGGSASYGDGYADVSLRVTVD